MSVRPETKREVMAHIISLMAEAEASGLDPWSYAAAKMPGVPSDVIADAFCQFENDKTEAWWQSVEKTIDAEVMCLALKGSTA